MMRRAALGLIAGLAGGTAIAHPWQEGLAPLGSDEVGAVVEVLADLGTEAAARGWIMPDGYAGSLAAAVSIYAADTSAFDRFPDYTQRVLMTYEALVSGDLLPDGSIPPGADVFMVLQSVHVEDAAAVAAWMEALRDVAGTFGLEAQ
jgi:hypothetical protein